MATRGIKDGLLQELAAQPGGNSCGSLRVAGAGGNGAQRGSEEVEMPEELTLMLILPHGVSNTGTCNNPGMLTSAIQAFDTGLLASMWVPVLLF